MLKIKKNGFSVGLWSDSYQVLAKWYEEILGFSVRQTAELPNDSFVAFDFGDNWFWIGKHDKVFGKNKDPYRIMIEFYVESVLKTYKELRDKGITIIAKPFVDPTDTKKYCITIQDPEGNILQFYGPK